MRNEWVRIQGFSMKTHGNNSGGSKKLCGMIWNCWDFVISKIYMYTWKEVHLCDPYIFVFSCMYTCLLTAERAQFYTLGSKNRFLYPYFNYLLDLFICCISVWVQGFYLCGKWRMICGCQVPPSILLILKIKLLSSDLVENAFNLWDGCLSVFNFKYQPQKRELRFFRSCLNATE